MLIWESAMGKPFELHLRGDVLLYYYALLLAGSENVPMSWDEFINALEEDPTIPAQFEVALQEGTKAAGIFHDEDSKKKARRAKSSH